MENEEITLNENDKILLVFCEDKRRSVGEISSFLKISPASISSRLKKLEKENLIVVERGGQGRKTYVRTKKGIKTNEHFKTILREIKKRGGSVTEEEYATLLPFNPFESKEQDRFDATLILPFVRPKLIEKRIFITKKGEEFLNKKG